MDSYIKDQYTKTLAKQLAKELSIGNMMAVPKLVKIVVNCSMGEALKDEKTLPKMAAQLGVITGQKVMVTKAKKAISSFKLRDGDAIGLKVTLRGKRMWDFFTRLIAVALPRVRDFRGIPGRGFDGSGNYTLGISEQTIFPELDYSLVDKNRGFEATFVTTAENDSHAKTLLVGLGMPFEKEKN